MTWQALFWWRAPCLLRRVVVNLSDDPHTSLRGVLWRQRGLWWTLRDADVLHPGEPPTHADGELLVHRGNVSFVEVLP